MLVFNPLVLDTLYFSYLIVPVSHFENEDFINIFFLIICSSNSLFFLKILPIILNNLLTISFTYDHVSLGLFIPLGVGDPMFSITCAYFINRLIFVSTYACPIVYSYFIWSDMYFFMHCISVGKWSNPSDYLFSLKSTNSLL